MFNLSYQVVVCDCTAAWSGDFCELDFDACLDNPCFPGVSCIDNVAPATGNLCGSGTCPNGLQGDGFKCAGEYTLIKRKIDISHSSTLIEKEGSTNGTKIENVY